MGNRIDAFVVDRSRRSGATGFIEKNNYTLKFTMSSSLNSTMADLTHLMNQYRETPLGPLLNEHGIPVPLTQKVCHNDVYFL